MAGHECKAGDKYISFRTEADLMPNMAAQFELIRHTARTHRAQLGSSPADLTRAAGGRWETLMNSVFIKTLR